MNDPDPMTLIKGRICGRLLQAAKTCRNSFLETAREIARYAYAPNHDFQYDSLPGGVNPSIKAKVAKTAQYLEVVGPLLYQQNPKRTVTPRRWADDMARQRASIMQDLLDYTPKETDLYGASRRAVQDACVSGAGFLWTEMDPDKGIPCSVHVPYRDVLLDPDARRWEEQGFIARRFLLPKYRLIAQHEAKPDVVERIRKMPTFAETESNRDSRHEWEQRDHGVDLVSVWRIWCRVGLQNYKGGVELIQAASSGLELERKELEDMATIEDRSPMVYTVTDDGKYIDEWEWEVPYHLDGDFPCTPLVFRHSPERLWPISPLEPGLPWQRALNHQWTLFLNRQKWAYRVLIAFAEQPGFKLTEDVMHQLMFGGDMGAFTFRSTEGLDISKLMQMVTFPTLAAENVQIVDQLERQFEQHTGLSDFILAGETARQMRSAEEARMREQKSMTRFEDMRSLVEKWAAKAARKEAMMARFLMKPDDIQRIFGPEAAQAWGMLMPPVSDQMTQAVMQLQQAGLDPNQAQIAVLQDPVRFGIQEGVDYKKWLLEADYEIESGTAQVKNNEQKIEALRELNNQTVATLIPNPNPAIQAHGLDIIADTMDAVGAPQESVARLRESAELLRQPPAAPVGPDGMPMAPEAAPAPDMAAASPAGAPAAPVADPLTGSLFMEGISVLAQAMTTPAPQVPPPQQPQTVQVINETRMDQESATAMGNAIAGAMANMPPAEVYVTVPPQAPPVVHVASPEIRLPDQPAPQVTVHVPEQKAAQVTVQVPEPKSSEAKPEKKRKRRRVTARPMPDGTIEMEEAE